MGNRNSRWMALGLGVSGGGQPAPSLDPDAQTLIDAMTVAPDSTRQTLINDTVIALKDAGIWSLLDECWFFAAHDAQAALLGWKRYRDCTAVNAPTFTVDEGFAGDGATSYLDANLAPATDGVQYTLNDASYGVYSRTDIASSAYTDMGCRASPDAGNNILKIRNDNDLMLWRINSGTPSPTGTSTDSRGLFAARRTASDARQVLRNGTIVSGDSNPSNELPTPTFYIGALHQGDSASEFSIRQYAFAFVAAAMSEQQQADLYAVVQDYMTAIGAAV